MWRTWPWASVSLDQGGDGVAGVHACLYKDSLKLNLFPWYDWSHGCCRDLEAAFRDVGKFQFMLMMLVALNIAHGPERDEGMRFEQLSEAWRHMLATYDPHTFELYQVAAPNIIRDLSGTLVLPGIDSPAVELWNWMKQEEVVIRIAPPTRPGVFGTSPR